MGMEISDKLVQAIGRLIKQIKDDVRSTLS